MFKIPLKSIETLANYSFVIPDYQRGYRWGQEEVGRLLDDIHDYGLLNDFPPTDYCLQPLIVQQQEGTDNCFAVLDGQQRLTTLVLLLKYLGKHSPHLAYQTREKVSEYLETCDAGAPQADCQTDEIDVLYMKSAFRCIHKKFEEWGKDPSFDKNLFAERILKQLQFIWYEPHGQKAETVFARINQGKIPLTNAELVKALLLAESQFPQSYSKGEIEETTSHLAILWEDIEKQLTDDFWYFLSQQETPCRIELLLDLLAGKEEKSEYFFTFKHFEKKLQNDFPAEDRLERIKKIMKEIRNLFFTFSEWREDKVLYHYVGLLTILQQPKDLKDIWKWWKGPLLKKDFAAKCLERVKEKMGLQQNGGELSVGKKGFEDLSYKENYDQIKEVLLYFNINQILQNKLSVEYIPFSQWKEWTVEHIYPQHPANLKEKEKEAILISYKNFYQTSKLPAQVPVAEKINQINQWLKNLSQVSSEDLNSLEPAAQDTHVCKDKHLIGNLALLGHGNNAALSNSPFMEKRVKLRELMAKGSYVPPATLNAFLKFYSNDIRQYLYWDEQDAADYREAIKQALKALLPK